MSPVRAAFSDQRVISRGKPDGGTLGVDHHSVCYVQVAVPAIYGHNVRTAEVGPRYEVQTPRVCTLDAGQVGEEGRMIQKVGIDVQIAGSSQGQNPWYLLRTVAPRGQIQSELRVRLPDVSISRPGTNLNPAVPLLSRVRFERSRD